MTRADFFRTLGLGAVLAPVIDGNPRVDLAAEVTAQNATMKPVEIYQMGDIDQFTRGFNSFRPGTLIFEDAGKRYECKVLLTEMSVQCDPIDVTSVGDGYRRFLPGVPEISFKGRVTGKLY